MHHDPTQIVAIGFIFYLKTVRAAPLRPQRFSGSAVRISRAPVDQCTNYFPAQYVAPHKLIPTAMAPILHQSGVDDHEAGMRAGAFLDSTGRT